MRRTARFLTAYATSAVDVYEAFADAAAESEDAARAYAAGPFDQWIEESASEESFAASQAVNAYAAEHC